MFQNSLAFYSKKQSEKFEQMLIKGKINLIKERMTQEEHQSFVHIKINDPIKSEITLINMNDRDIGQEKNELIIENIGPGGLRFLSNLKLEMGQEIIYFFEIGEIDEKVPLVGEIIWNNDLSDRLYQYGVHFNIPEDIRAYLTDLLNTYSEKYFKTFRL
jgi:Tfp pilus assembly protein PilZ